MYLGTQLQPRWRMCGEPSSGIESDAKMTLRSRLRCTNGGDDLMFAQFSEQISSETTRLLLTTKSYHPGNMHKYMPFTQTIYKSRILAIALTSKALRCTSLVSFALFGLSNETAETHMPVAVICLSYLAVLTLRKYKLRMARKSDLEIRRILQLAVEMFITRII